MRRMIVFSAMLVVVSLGNVPLAWGANAVITTPKQGETIPERRNFPVEVSIPDYNKDAAAGFHYWISLASGKDELIDHWPKFYVRTGRHAGRLHDGGENPLREKQPMTILLLRVDGATNQHFVRWLQEGRKRGLWEALKVKRSEIAASVLIYFP